VLLKLFPNKPFYLTEYGYTTKYVAAFGGFPVSQVLQASYLTRSYSYLSRYPQVKVLLWFLVQDLPPNSGKEAYYGVYMGLRTTLGVPKLSWFAFAGGNHLSVTMPSTVKLGDTMPISGELTTSFLPATPRQTLIVERKLPGQDWVKVKLFHTFAGGAFATTVRPRVSGAIWRVRWNPIAVSSSQMVTVNQ